MRQLAVILNLVSLGRYCVEMIEPILHGSISISSFRIPFPRSGSYDTISKGEWRNGIVVTNTRWNWLKTMIFCFGKLLSHCLICNTTAAVLVEGRTWSSRSSHFIVSLTDRRGRSGPFSVRSPCGFIFGAFLGGGAGITSASNSFKPAQGRASVKTSSHLRHFV